MVITMQNKSLKKVCIVAGNGPSLKEIDYSLLPLDYDVFRCNQFYFEDKYYLGKDIDSVFFVRHAFFESYYTLRHLLLNKEYSVKNVFCDQTYSHIDTYFSFIDIAHIFLKNQLKDFYSLINLELLYNNRYPTSGIYMCAVAIALGYKEICLCGIDFYDKTKDYYAFDTKKQNLLCFDAGFGKSHNKSDFHSKEYDIECLRFLQNNYDCKIYSLCPNSSLSKHIALAPKTNNIFIVEDKPNGYTNDLMIPSDQAYIYYGTKSSEM